jgi:hypothetical protein
MCRLASAPRPAPSARGAHVVLLLQEDDLAANESRGDHPVHDREREDDRLDVLRLQPDEDEDDDAHRQPANREQPVEETHHRGVHPPAEQAGRRAVAHAEDEDDREGGAGDQERRPPPGGEAGEPSRPNWSVPSQCSPLGGWRTTVKSASFGSNGDSAGTRTQ